MAFCRNQGNKGHDCSVIQGALSKLLEFQKLVASDLGKLRYK